MPEALKPSLIDDKYSLNLPCLQTKHFPCHKTYVTRLEPQAEY